MINILKEKYVRLMGRLLRFKINVLNASQSIDYIKKNKVSVIRFGDGEFDLIRGNDIPYQKFDKRLGSDMKNIILKGTTDKVLVCLPDVFHNLDRYTEESKKFFYDYFFYQNRNLLKEISKNKDKIYGSTFLSRPYIDMKEKNNADIYFKKLKSIWNDQDILIVEGKLTRSGEGNDLFSSAKNIKRIICPSNNAFFKKEDIEQSIVEHSDNRLILLMLGPTAKIIVNDLSYLPNQMIDLGHIDTEYEWFKMGVTKKTKIPNKHTAEFNNDDSTVIIDNNEDFNKQIIDIVN